MKKILVTCFYLLLTLAISASSFLFPSILNAYQDKQNFATIEHSAMEPLELTYSSSLYDTLRLFSGSHYFVEYPSTGSSRTDDEIYAIAYDMLKEMKKYNLLPAISAFDISSHTTTLQLAITSDGHSYTNVYDSAPAQGLFPSASDSQGSIEEYAMTPDLAITSAVVWACPVYFSSGYWVHFWIDDKSGKVVSFSMQTSQTEQVCASGEPEMDAFADATAALFEEYYGLPARSLQQSIIYAYNSVFEKSDMITDARYIIRFKEDNGPTIQIPLRMLSGHMLLN